MYIIIKSRFKKQMERVIEAMNDSKPCNSGSSISSGGAIWLDRKDVSGVRVDDGGRVSLDEVKERIGKTVVCTTRVNTDSGSVSIEREVLSDKVKCKR